ncbi:MAG: PAS domain S-box protein [Syntrophales bacterium]|nr:PAS domain S-box protein [Syntrophales bacterium]MDD5532837.1 PAS domain S-box protein [Syntrophales bacterium]
MKAKKHNDRHEIKKKDSLLFFSRTGKRMKNRMHPEMFRSIVESAGDSIYLVDRDCRYLFINSAHLLRLGMSNEDVTGKSYGEFHTKRQAKEFERRVNEVFETGKKAQHEHRSRRDQRYFLRTFSPLKNPSDGEVIGVTVVSKDITDIKRAESALQKSEEKYRSIFENAVVGIFQTSPEGKLLNSNTAFARMYGYQNPRDLAAEIEDVGRQLYADDRDRRKVVKILMKQGSVGPCEFPVRHRNGSIFWISMTARAVRNSTGRLLYYEGMNVDVTESRLAAEKTRESEERWRQLFNAMPSGVAVLDAVDGGRDFIIKDFNAAGEKIEGIPGKDILGRPVTEAFPGVRAFGILDVFERVWKTGHPEYLPASLYQDGRNPGSWRENWVFKLPGGEIVAIYNDITGRKRIEEQLRASEEKHRGIIENMDEGYHEVNLAGSLTFFNESFRKMMGYSRQELPGMNYRKYAADEENAKKIYQAYNEVYRTGKRLEWFEWEIARKDGAKRTLMVTANLKRDREGRPSGFSGIVNDITEIKKAEQDLRQSEAILAEAEKIAHLGSAEVNFETGKVKWSDEHYRIWGYQPGEVKPSLELMINALHPADREIMAQAIVDEIEEKHCLDVEVRVVRPNGDVRFVRCISNTHRSAEGKAMRILGTAQDITDRKQMEERLKVSEEKYRNILEDMKDGYWEVDLRGNMTFCNPVLPEFLGYSGDEVIGMSYRAYMDPETAETVRESFQSVYRNDKPKMARYKITRKDGTQAIVETSVSLRKSKGGAAVGFQGIMRDITGRVKNEQALRQSRDYLQKLNDALGDAVATFKFPDRTIEYANRAAMDMSGYTGDEIFGRNAGILYPDEEQYLKVGDILADAMKKGKEVVRFETVLKRKTGETFPVQVTATFIKNGGVSRIITVSQDISLRRRAEESLRAAEELYRTLATNSQTAIYIVQDGKIRFTNPYLLQYSGYSEEELMGVEIEKFIHPEDRKMVRGKAVRMLKGELKSPYEYRIIDRYGQTRWLVETVASIDFQGRKATLGGTMDITEKKLLEQQLDNTREMLMQSEKLAAIGKLSAGVVHEILNPLNVISMRLQLLEKTEILSEKARNALEICTAQVERIVKITRNINQFSRISTRNVVQGNFNESAERVLMLMEPKLKTNNATVERAYAYDLPLVPMDISRIEQVILNLVNNALDAMSGREGKKIRACTFLKESDGKKFVVASFSDNGTGIHPDDMRKIFDPFFTTKGPDKGTGLGLSVSYGIIKDHNGRIWAENNEWGGASFFIELPIH